MYLAVCPPCGPGSTPSHGGVFQRNFSPADHTRSIRLEPAWQKMAEAPLNGTTQTCGD